jgi:hypothetical protein
MVAFKLKSPGGLGPNLLVSKYLGFKSYGQMRSYVIGANALWGPIVGVGSLALMVRLGWPEALLVAAFPLGYSVSFWRFLKKPRKAWEDEKLPKSQI